MLKLRNQITILTKVKAHANVNGNERVGKFTKVGTTLLHRLLIHLYEEAYSTSYHLHKDQWHFMAKTPYKGPIRHLQ
jgi:hypothetical protein